MKELFKRFRARTPLFFKRLRNTCVAIGTTSVLCYQWKEMLPPIVVEYLSYGVTIGVVGAFISQLACLNPEEIKNKKSDENI